MRIYEAFSEGLRRLARAKTDSCAICHIVIPPDGAYDDHSATGLHLHRKNTKNGPKFIATSTAEGHKAMRGRAIDLRIWPYGTETDGVIVCLDCHKELGRVARAEANLRGYHGSAVPPQIMAEVTAFAVKRGKPLSFELI